MVVLLWPEESAPNSDWTEKLKTEQTAWYEARVKRQRQTERENSKKQNIETKKNIVPIFSLALMKRGYHGPLEQYSGDAQHEVENESGIRISPFIRPVSLKQRPPKDREPTFFPLPALDRFLQRKKKNRARCRASAQM